MTPLELRTACADLLLRKAGLDPKRWQAALDRFGEEIKCGVRATVARAVELLPRITEKEFGFHPELTVAHWLVLAELVPSYDERRMWGYRIVYMNFSARVLRTEIDTALASRAFKAAKEAERAAKK